MKIIDSFIFYNELDLLYYRLSILDPYIYKFILVESTHTFTGNKKPLYYAENVEMFSKFNHKIIHIIVDDFPYIIPNISYQMGQQWQNEYHQRNSIKRGVESIVELLDENDIILTSDVDEIPNPTILIKAIDGSLLYNKTSLNRLALDMYYYNLYYRIGNGSNWHGIKLMTFNAYKLINLTFQDMRLHEHSTYVPIIEDGGWHLSYFGDTEFITKKIASFSHQEYNNDRFINKDTLEEKIKAGINLLNNSELNYIPIESNTNLPYQYDIYLKKYF
jgi:beta-1,4-mannosyl-glycoprotein beta-1,4-N-acetylglucosaminyltransferase